MSLRKTLSKYSDEIIYTLIGLGLLYFFKVIP